MQAKWRNLSILFFHMMNLFIFRHKLAFKQVVHFLSPSVYSYVEGTEKNRLNEHPKQM